jgi:hypothetical protein
VIYLLDASVLITAHNNYYPVDRVPEFWDWLHHNAEAGAIKMPIETYEEIKDGPKKKDLLFAWVQGASVQEALILDEDVDADAVDKVVVHGYGDDLTDDQVEQLGRDPFLISYALAAPADRCIVTVEVSKPGKKRHNRHIPDVCKTMDAKYCDPFTMYRLLGFSTNWKKKG